MFSHMVNLFLLVLETKFTVRKERYVPYALLFKFIDDKKKACVLGVNMFSFSSFWAHKEENAPCCWLTTWSPRRPSSRHTDSLIDGVKFFLEKYLKIPRIFEPHVHGPDIFQHKIFSVHFSGYDKPNY